MTTVFGSAIACRRAARFGVSPTMLRSFVSPVPIRSPTTTSPVAIPMRVCRERVDSTAVTAAISSSPARYRPFGIVLVRARIAEINQHAVAMVFRNEPIEAAHRFGDNVLIGQNDLTQIFRVHAGGECRRTNKVREHHRDLPPLG